MKELISFISAFSVLAVVAIHLLVGAVEMLFWSRPGVYTRLDRFGFTESEARHVAPIVANAGLYNLFIAAGLGTSIYVGDVRFTFFFLACVAVAGLYGAATLKRTTLVIQTLPAIAAALLVWRSWAG